MNVPATVLCVSCISLVGAVQVTSPPGGSSTAPVAFQIDSAHSSVAFRIKRDVAFFFGRFDRIEGELKLDEDDPEASSIELRIDAESVYTGNERRDNHLRSPDFFDVKQFPKITFKSTKVVQAEDDLFDVDGELEIHGVKKAIQVSVQKTGEQTGRGTRIGFELSFEIKRSDFDMTYGRGALGDEVTVMAGIAAQAGGGRGGRGRRRGD